MCTPNTANNGLSTQFSYYKTHNDYILFPVLGVTRYLCNALCNIITFVVPK